MAKIDRLWIATVTHDRDDAWSPKRVLVPGRAPRRIVALAMETDLDHRMSTDGSEGKSSVILPVL